MEQRITTNKLSKADDKSRYEVALTVSPEMVTAFSRLTGDFSSLHTDADFGRVSAFRTNVAHGMLPVLFVLCPSVSWKPGKKAWIKKLSGTFLKPVFIGDEILVTVKEEESAQDTATFEYKVVHKASQAVVTSGKMELQYDVSDKQPLLPQSAVQGSLLSVPLKERQNVAIEKGSGDAFSFGLSSETMGSLLGIIRTGLPDGLFSPETWTKHCDPANLLAVSLCSTFVGMCIPGEKATFVDFQGDFATALPLSQKYRFAGEVKFHSSSTNILVEGWQITSEGEDKKMLAKGEIKTKINDPRRSMPSIAELKSRAIDLQLDNKVALVTGASRGIGETTAKLLSLFGAKVIINYNRGKEDALRIQKEIEQNGGKAMVFQADVADRSQVQNMVKAAVEKFGRIDILVNNAVRDARPMPFLETTWEEVQKDIDVTVKGAFNCCQEIVPGMIKNKGGKIINLSTIFAENPPAHQAKYVISKSALVGLTRTLAVELAPHNIQVNMVVPSVALTDLSSHVPSFFMERMKNESPMKRHVSPEEVAQSIVFLASAFSAFTTGQKIMVTGGQAPLL